MSEPVRPELLYDDETLAREFGVSAGRLEWDRLGGRLASHDLNGRKVTTGDAVNRWLLTWQTDRAARAGGNDALMNRAPADEAATTNRGAAP